MVGVAVIVVRVAHQPALFQRPLQSSVGAQLAGDEVVQLPEVDHVVQCVLHLLFAHRAARPVGYGVALTHTVAGLGLHELSKARRIAVSDKGGRHLGVEYIGGRDAVGTVQQAVVVVAGVRDLYDVRVLQQLQKRSEIFDG